MEKIKTQANKVRELVFAADTGATYKKTLVLTWNILRETGLLLWLVVCLLFVGGEWFWQNSISLGRKLRVWYDQMQTSDASESKSATEIGQSALTALHSGAETLLYQAKKQLGINAEPPAPKRSPNPRPTPHPPTPTSEAIENTKPTVPSEAEATPKSATSPKPESSAEVEDTTSEDED